MKKIFLIMALVFCTAGLRAQSCYWVVLTDKEGTTFDPYSYFDAKAIERYRLNHADLYDISNYPLNEHYVSTIDGIATEEVGASRWLNAVAVMATEEQIARIEALPFVKQVDPIASEMQIARWRAESQSLPAPQAKKGGAVLTDQLLRMQGDLFKAKGIDATGIRIAVFDGGFHAVNTHDAFKHLRDRNAIIATWDFTKKQPHVYDNHTHGTMVLSCIAGMIDGRQLGLATGATFLLAKTEVEPEPFKEEVWWAQAMEWADKNGADVINSSLGYGGDRHYTNEMDGRSYVAKAANMAARKGMLVCNSAGNEGDDDTWKTIITPADADSVLCVGGIIASLTHYQHISFSSYGPGADGRQKPNICAFGHAEVADPHDDTNTTFAYGTSFASPLAAGFVACAWQSHRDLTAMQLKEEIEKSGDLYPYCDYALGYGVPRASYFTDWDVRSIEPAATFYIEDSEEHPSYVLITPNNSKQRKAKKSKEAGNRLSQLGNEESAAGEPLFMKVTNRDGIIDEYVHLEMKNFDDSSRIAIPKGALCGKTLTVHYAGFTNTYSLSKSENLAYASEMQDFSYYYIKPDGYLIDGMYSSLERTLDDNKVSAWGHGQRWEFNYYISYGIPWFFDNDPMEYSDDWHIGFRFLHNFKKWYSLGLALDFNTTYYNYQPDALNVWDYAVTPSVTDYSDADEKTMLCSQFDLELFQRIRFIPGGSKTQKGLFWDLGLYGGIDWHAYQVEYNENHIPNTSGTTVTYSEVAPLNNTFSFGLTSRLGWDFIALYGRYRLSQPNLGMPRLELGLEVSF